MNVVGQENLAKRLIMGVDLISVNVGGIDFQILKRNIDGMIMGINNVGDIYWTSNVPGAWETCRSDGNLLYYKHGVVSYGSNYLS